MIPFSIPQIDTNYLEIIYRALKNKSVFEGEEITGFEKDFAAFIGVKYAVCFSSARYGLYLLYKFFGCQGRKVFFPSYTCIPALDALRWAEGEPWFCDIDPGTYNPVLPTDINLSERIGAVTLSYLYGLVGDIEPALKFAREHKIPVIEDAAIALGAEYKGRKAGSLGDAAVFSLQSSKIITAWKGGVVTTDNQELYQFLTREKNKLPYPSCAKLIFNLLLTYLRGTLFSGRKVYGAVVSPLRKALSCKLMAGGASWLLDQDPSEAVTAQSSRLLPEYEKVRFTNLQAAVALASLRNIGKILFKRRALAKMYYEELSRLGGVILPKPLPECSHAYGRYPIRLKGYTKQKMKHLLGSLGIEAAGYYPYICPQTFFYKDVYGGDRFPNAAKAAEETFLLPLHTRLKQEDVLYVTGCLARIKKEEN